MNPTMFRRRTDKVYATLQQVQRRLTQNTDAQGASYSSAAPSYPAHPTSPTAELPDERSQKSPSTRGFMRQHSSLDSHPGAVVYPPGMTPPKPPSPPPVEPAWPSASSAEGASEPDLAPPAAGAPPSQVGMPSTPEGPGWPQPAPPYQPPASSPQRLAQVGSGVHRADDQAEVTANAGINLAASEGRKRGLVLSQELAGVLVLLWLLTVGVAFMIGQSQARPAGIDDDLDRPEVSFRDTQPADAGHEVTADGRSGGGADAVIRPRGDHVIVLGSVPDNTQRALKIYQDKAARDNETAAKTAGRIPPWFGVRAPRSGGLQYVYGVIDGEPGIPRDTDTEQLYKLLKNNFKQARWLDIGD